MESRMLVWEIDCGRRARRAAKYAVGVNSEVPCSPRVSSTAESTTAACARGAATKVTK